MSAYRPDVDGLRAIAVIAVVAFHAGIPGFGGGFAGVDVFYVISGYLITGLLADEVSSSGSLDLASFYARRVRRLLPALCLVVLTTLALGAVFLHPFGERQELARSAVATALFASNFFFWNTTGGYFHHDVTLRPLLHTWSLAVEEQFYIVWPLLLALLHRSAARAGVPFRRFATPVIAAIFAGSLLLAIGSSGNAAFFLLPARAWELALGALLALRLPGTRQPGGAVAAAIGLLALLGLAATVLVFDDTSPWPGVRTILPVAATAALIAAGTRHPSGPARLLGAQPVAYLGRLSYSWYLWHWPLLAILRAQTLGERYLGAAVALAGLSLALAALTYHAVEKPVRLKRVWLFAAKGATLVSGAGLLTVMLAGAGALGLEARWAAGAHQTEYREYAAARGEFPPLTRHCAQDPPFGRLPSEADCTMGEADRPIRLVLWGDSHADQFGATLAAYAQQQHLRVLQRVVRLCPPLADYEPPILGPDAASCAEFNAAVLRELAQLRPLGLEGVVLAARWMLYDGGRTLSVWRVKRTGAGSARDEQTAVRRSLLATIGRLHALGLRVLIVAPVPEMRYDVPECFARNPTRPAVCDVARTLVDANRADFVRALSAAAAAVPDTRVWDPIGQFCDARYCHASRGSVLLFHDDSHISGAAARAAYPAAAALLGWAAGGE